MLLLALAVLPVLPARADTTYLSTEALVHQTFGKAPPPQFLWLDDAIQQRLAAVLGHRYPQARLHYWAADSKTLWILNEIGKEYPITAGFVVADGHIERAAVLVYRESRGTEIHLPAFLQQFRGSHLQDDRLTPAVDGITGATLSVGAMRRMAGAALVLDAASRRQPAP